MTFSLLVASDAHYRGQHVVDGNVGGDMRIGGPFDESDGLLRRNF